MQHVQPGQVMLLGTTAAEMLTKATATLYFPTTVGRFTKRTDQRIGSLELHDVGFARSRRTLSEVLLGRDDARIDRQRAIIVDTNVADGG
jgi:hypothetical protein